MSSSLSSPQCEECGSPYPVQGWTICLECIHKLDAQGVSRRQVQGLGVRRQEMRGQLDMLDLLEDGKGNE